MANTYSDIAGGPGIFGYPLVNKQTNSSQANGAQNADAQNAADFQRILNKLSAAAATQKAANSSSTSSATSTSSNSGHSFKSFMKNVWDVINPLQHIPVVSAIYHHATGDTISPAAHFAGDALYGGAIGGAIAAADIAYQKATGKDVGETVIASLTGGNKNPSAPANSNIMIAQNLTQLTPAAGRGTTSAPHAHAGKNIIWSDNNSSIASNNSGGNTAKNIVWTSGSPLFPPSQPTGTIGEGPASPSPAQPVLQASSTASTSTSQTQEAPAGAARKAMPPELIASKMMDGLQKYAAMKQQDMNPQMSGLY